MTVTAEQWRAYGQQFVDQGYDYCINCDRCGGSCHCLDCSGCQCRISNGLGLTRNLCTTSFVMAQECTRNGLQMSWAFALSDAGPDVFWAFRGADDGRRDDGSKPNGASGHVVTVVRVRDANGHTIRFYTIEAMGHAYGVVNGTFENRGFSGLYRIPGVLDRPPAPPAPPEESMFIASPHTPIPASSIAGAIWVTGNPNSCLLVNGCSIAGDRPVNAATWKPGDDRIWDAPVPAGHKGVGISPRVWLYGSPDPDEHPPGTPTGTGIVLADNHGDTQIGNWSH